MDKPRIALALSGGGMRAAAFHLGVLARLAAEGLLERVTFISTVSGGSLLTGLVFELSSHRWPGSEEFSSTVMPSITELFTSRNLQRDFLVRNLRQPWLWPHGRAKILSESLREIWRINGALQDIPDDPRWVINATTYETGRNWRFMPQRMGDYSVGYVARPTLSLSDAMAASAAVPGLIGPLVITARNFEWSSFIDSVLTPSTAPKYKRIHLWDGGIYDNLGVEALFKTESATIFRDEYDFLLVSDGSSPLQEKAPRMYGGAMRLIDVATSQIRALRSRSLVTHFRTHPGSGAYIRLGNTASAIAAAAGSSMSTATTLDLGTVDRLRRMGTHLNSLSTGDLALLTQHGWETTNYTFCSYLPKSFLHLPWAQAR